MYVNPKVGVGKAERSEATRRALTRAAREMFSEQGYANAPTEEIVQRAGVTRGALYYHFRDKEDLFAAVFAEVGRELAERVAAASRRAVAPWERCMVGCQAFLDACLDPLVRRIMLVDAPSILGWQRWWEIDEEHGFSRLLRHGLQVAMDADLIERQPVELLAAMVMGALREAALVLAEAQDASQLRAQVRTALERLVGGPRITGAQHRDL